MLNAAIINLQEIGQIIGINLYKNNCIVAEKLKIRRRFTFPFFFKYEFGGQSILNLIE